MSELNGLNEFRRRPGRKLPPDWILVLAADLMANERLRLVDLPELVRTRVAGRWDVPETLHWDTVRRWAKLAREKASRGEIEFDIERGFFQSIGQELEAGEAL